MWHLHGIIKKFYILDTNGFWFFSHQSYLLLQVTAKKNSGGVLGRGSGLKNLIRHSMFRWSGWCCSITEQMHLCGMYDVLFADDVLWLRPLCLTAPSDNGILCVVRVQQGLVVYCNWVFALCNSRPLVCNVSLCCCRGCEVVPQTV